MKAVLIFDSTINLIYWKWDDTFLEQMRRFNDQVSNCFIYFHYISRYYLKTKWTKLRVQLVFSQNSDRIFVWVFIIHIIRVYFLKYNLQYAF